jgi:hypothetical protein
MRGRGIDNEFVSSFIQECAGAGKVAQEEICAAALGKIDEIDTQLKMRSRYADVLIFFNHKKKREIEPIEPVLSFDGIDKGNAREILNIIGKSYYIGGNEIKLRFSEFDDKKKKDLIFTLKQMIAAKVIFRNEKGFIFYGENLKLYNAEKNI